ncbi:hypothetical protein GCM10023222_39820 [Saccharopolyspora cebuensis]
MVDVAGADGDTGNGRQLVGQSERHLRRRALLVVSQERAKIDGIPHGVCRTSLTDRHLPPDTGGGAIDPAAFGESRGSAAENPPESGSAATASVALHRAGMSSHVGDPAQCTTGMGESVAGNRR